MTPIDAAKNLVKVTVATGYDEAANYVALIADDGAKLPDVPFNATWWNATDYADPTDDPNVEIVRVTANASDGLTIVRAQEDTSASTKNTVGKTYYLIAGVTALTLSSIATALLDHETRLEELNGLPEKFRSLLASLALSGIELPGELAAEIELT